MKEFKCVITRTTREDVVSESESVLGKTKLKTLRAASLEMKTCGPFLYDELHQLVGRTVMIMILEVVKPSSPEDRGTPPARSAAGSPV